MKATMKNVAPVCASLVKIRLNQKRTENNSDASDDVDKMRNLLRNGRVVCFDLNCQAYHVAYDSAIAGQYDEAFDVDCLLE